MEARAFSALARAAAVSVAIAVYRHREAGGRLFAYLCRETRDQLRTVANSLRPHLFRHRRERRDQAELLRFEQNSERASDLQPEKLPMIAAELFVDDHQVCFQHTGQLDGVAFSGVEFPERRLGRAGNGADTISNHEKVESSGTMIGPPPRHSAATDAATCTR